MPERTWQRWQARARTQISVKGPWPAPVAEANEPYLVKHAEAHPAWEHRKVGDDPPRRARGLGVDRAAGAVAPRRRPTYSRQCCWIKFWRRCGRIAR